MPVAESSTASANEQRQHQREVQQDMQQDIASISTPAPTPTSSRGGFYADDEEKAGTRGASNTPSGSVDPGTYTPSSRNRKRKKTKRKEGEHGPRSHGSRAHSTFLERLKPALVLKNSGSTARDHLASERTFLAYVRTSLALASTGVALVQLFTIADLTSQSYNLPDTAKCLQRFSRPLGSTTIPLGIIVLVIGFIRYFAVQSALIRGVYPTARTSIVFITIVLLTILRGEIDSLSISITRYECIIIHVPNVFTMATIAWRLCSKKNMRRIEFGHSDLDSGVFSSLDIALLRRTD